ncbi:TlpA family protein disulfide reductase [Algoriphagus halophytocola]|uniref:TlpA family protein disulfide reductase n=1 Tax=Algoriphagus halophytocola TaxID=2991499 RepID=A0ABY6MGN9_9BACT|nr:TlpA disulfide reductase family protein [Algoriphagus sp. TR-M5]UZD21811.1 TlpA family protein disulfide reductase [Algoriphagus sp. TR-M5]
MKKLILFCLLGYLYVPTSTSTAQVADPPGADFLHRSMPHVSSGVEEAHRGGDSRPDTLSIGDQIPSGIEFSEVLQYDSDKLRLDDYRGRYVILEFWAPTCTASIGSLPQMDKLAAKYGDRLQIIPITFFPKEKVMEVIEGYQNLQSLTIPLVLNSSRLLEYFPHITIPHMVILDPTGKVIAITGMEDLTETNLDQLLATGEAPFRRKSDKRIRIPSSAKLISETPQLPNKNIWFQSAFTGYIPDVGGSLVQRFDAMSEIRIMNMPLLYHYQLAYSGRDLVDYFGRNRIELEGFDPEELWTKKRGRDYIDWMKEGTHVFGYELIVPPSMDHYSLMREDLKRFLPHIQAVVEPRIKKVYALVQQEGRQFPKAASEKQAYKTLFNGVKMENYPLQGFVYHLNSLFMANSSMPVVNATGIDYPIDLELNAQLGSVESLRAALQQNGLDLIEREEEIPVLVLRKISQPKFLTP